MAAFIEKWRDQIAGATLFFVAAILYFHTTSFDFQVTWDDGDYVLNNPHITGFSLQNLISLFNRPYLGLYGPIQMLTYVIDYNVWGLDPFGYHLSNVLIHSLNVVLAFFVLRRITGEFMLSLFVALMYAVHPLNVENVAWIAERKTLVSSFFVLASVLFYLRYRTPGGGARGSYIASVVLFVFAAFAKGTVIGLPLVLLAYEWLLRGIGERRFRSLAPYFFIAALAAGGTLWATISTEVVGGGAGISAELLIGRVNPTLLTVWWEYIRLLIFPFGLSAYYIPTVRGSFLDPIVLAAILGWIVVLERILFRASPQVKFWFLWAAFFFAPTSGLVPWVVYYADRYMYLPGIGVYVMVGMAASWAYRRLAENWPKLTVMGNQVALAGMVLVALVYGGIAYQRSAVWENELTLWQDTTLKSPEFSDGHLNLGAANLRAGRLDEAEAAYRRAHELGHSKGEVGLWVVEERRRQRRAQE